MSVNVGLRGSRHSVAQATHVTTKDIVRSFCPDRRVVVTEAIERAIEEV
jgi:hypothetical protein